MWFLRRKVYFIRRFANMYNYTVKRASARNYPLPRSSLNGRSANRSEGGLASVRLLLGPWRAYEESRENQDGQAVPSLFGRWTWYLYSAGSSSFITSSMRGLA